MEHALVPGASTAEAQITVFTLPVSSTTVKLNNVSLTFTLAVVLAVITLRPSHNAIKFALEDFVDLVSSRITQA